MLSHLAFTVGLQHGVCQIRSGNGIGRFLLALLLLVVAFFLALLARLFLLTVVDSRQDLAPYSKYASARCELAWERVSLRLLRAYRGEMFGGRAGGGRFAGSHASIPVGLWEAAVNLVKYFEFRQLVRQ